MLLPYLCLIALDRPLFYEYFFFLFLLLFLGAFFKPSYTFGIQSILLQGPMHLPALNFFQRFIA